MRTSPAFRVVRVVLLLLFAVFFFGPLLAMLDFSTRGTNGSRTWAAWANLVEDPELNRAIVASLLLSLFTAVYAAEELLYIEYRRHHECHPLQGRHRSRPSKSQSFTERRSVGL